MYCFIAPIRRFKLALTVNRQDDGSTLRDDRQIDKQMVCPIMFQCFLNGPPFPSVFYGLFPTWMHEIRPSEFGKHSICHVSLIQVGRRNITLWSTLFTLRRVSTYSWYTYPFLWSCYTRHSVRQVFASCAEGNPPLLSCRNQNKCWKTPTFED